MLYRGKRGEGGGVGGGGGGAVQPELNLKCQTFKSPVDHRYIEKAK